MDFNQIHALFPQAKLEDKQEDSEKYYFKFNNQWLSIPQNAITSKEVGILNLFLNKTDYIKKDNCKSQWYNFLFKDYPLPPKTNYKLRFIHAFIDYKNNLQAKKHWNTFFKDAFNDNNLIDSFWISDKQCLFIEKIDTDNYQMNEFSDLIQSLDLELNTKTKIFIGHAWNSDNALRKIYFEEHKIFEYELPLVTSAVVTTSQVALQYWISNKLQDDPLLTNYKKQLNLSTQIKEIILALYHEKGNISSAAKRLFLHRNTLQYQIDKFYKNTGLNLKKMDDLIFCYLLTL